MDRWMDGSFTVRCHAANSCLLVIMVAESPENQVLFTFVHFSSEEMCSSRNSQLTSLFRAICQSVGVHGKEM